MDFHKWNFVWALLFALEAFFATAGNIVTLIIFQNRRLRKRPHFLLISLAVADLLVGLLSIPLYIAVNYVQNGSRVFHALVRGADMLPGFASIFTLVVISLERMYAIGWPFRHRVLKTQTYIVAIATPWVMAFVVTSCANLLQFVNKTSKELVTTFLITPIGLACTAYLLLWKKERSRPMCRHGVRETRDERLTKTVGLITAAFLVTWLPFQILHLVISLCPTCKISVISVIAAKLFHYANSIINIVIYPIRCKEYRTALFQMLTSICNYVYLRRNRRIAQSSANTGNSIVFVVGKSSDTQVNFDHFHENTRL